MHLLNTQPRRRLTLVDDTDCLPPHLDRAAESDALQQRRHLLNLTHGRPPDVQARSQRVRLVKVRERGACEQMALGSAERVRTTEEDTCTSRAAIRGASCSSDSVEEASEAMALVSIGIVWKGSFFCVVTTGARSGKGAPRLVALPLTD